MRIEIRCHDVDLNEQERQVARRRLRLALARLSSRIARVNARIADVNGPRGGVDHECRLALQIRGIGLIVIDKIAAEPLAALSLAADGAGRAVSRRLARARGLGRSRGRRAPLLATR